MSCYKSYPNQLSLQVSTSNTDWQLLGTNGTGYASHAAALSAGTTAFPGGPSRFPTGLPRVIISALTSGGAAGGAAMLVAINTLITPTASIPVASGDVLVLDDANVKSIWVKKATAGDIANVVGEF